MAQHDHMTGCPCGLYRECVPGCTAGRGCNIPLIPQGEAPARRTPQDYAIEFGRYLATAAENFMEEQNRAAAAGDLPCADFWNHLAGCIHEFRKRALRAEQDTKRTI
jgi:hypothetical protein